MSPEQIFVSVWLGVAVAGILGCAFYDGYRGHSDDNGPSILFAIITWPGLLLLAVILGPPVLVFEGVKWLGKKAGGR